MQSMFGNDPRMQRAMQMMQGKSPEEQQRTAMNVMNNSPLGRMFGMGNPNGNGQPPMQNNRQTVNPQTNGRRR